MDLNEAIKYHKDKAKELKAESEHYTFQHLGEKIVVTDIDVERYKECYFQAIENEQLAEWLTELKEWRKLKLICANKGVFVYIKIESEAEND